MIGIIAAMDKELKGLIKHIENPKTDVISGREFVSGTIAGTDVVMAICGIGKVNAAICAQTMILKYAPDRVINTGVAGALSKDLKICDVVAASYTVQHDVDTTALGDEIGFVSTVNTVKFPCDRHLSDAILRCVEQVNVRGIMGGIASGDQFISKLEQKRFISETFGCIACEMEGGAIAHVCLTNQTPCAIIRAISDGADEAAQMTYTTFAEKAAANSVAALLKYLQSC